MAQARNPCRRNVTGRNGFSDAQLRIKARRFAAPRNDESG
jgi:hypothetical protein